MSVKAILGTFVISGLDVKTDSQFNDVVAKIQEAGRKVLWDHPQYKGLKLESDFSLDADEKAGHFDGEST